MQSRTRSCRKIANFALVLQLMLTASIAQAEVITAADVGSSFTINWFFASGATDPNGNTNNTGEDITATAEFVFAGYDLSAKTIDLTITLTNTTDVNNDDEIGIWKMGYGTTPNATSVSFIDDNDGEMIDAVLGSFPAFPDSAIIDITSTSKPGAPKRLLAGEFDTFTNVIGFSDLDANFAVEIDPFNLFIQSDPDSFQITSEPPPTVPEPLPLTLLSVGLFMVALLRRRRLP